MNRRGLLGMLAAAPVAGRQMVDVALANVNRSGLAQGGNVLGHINAAGACGSVPSVRDWAKERLKALLESRGQRVRDLMRQIDRLDPDLASSKSLSFSAKLRMQAERIEREEFDREHTTLTQQITRYMGKGD